MDALSGINTVTLDDLEAPDPSEPLRILRAVFTDPEALRPTFDRAELTEAAARHFAELAGALHARGHEPGAVAHFLDKLLFCLFAEDTGLLPKGLLSRLSEPPWVRRGLGRLESGGLASCLWALIVGRLEIRHSAA
jgi:hypothetical protein